MYRKLLAETSNQHSATAKVVAMERDWISYRDRYMAAMYPANDKQAEYGSMFPMESDLLRAQLAKQHINELRALLKQYVAAGD